MNAEKQLIKDIKETCPFYNVDFPKTIECTEATPSESGYDYYENDDSSAGGMFWDFVKFEGRYIYVEFACEESRRVMGYDIKINEFEITDDPDSPKEFDILIKELDFVKQVLLQSDYI